MPHANIEEAVLDDDIRWMRRALMLAQHGAAEGEVPVGAVVVRAGAVIGEGWNCPIATHDPTAHAEGVALRKAAKNTGNYRLTGATTLYVTLEPCVMCVGAMVHARIGRLVFGAYDPKAGALVSTRHLLEDAGFNHPIHYEGGLLAGECGARLTQFFEARRDSKRARQ